MMAKFIKVKAMVDKENNRVLFAEADEDFGDVLFSFLTLPMGKIVSLTDKEKHPKMAIGCMNKLYESVRNLDVKYFRTQECQQMLLCPRNGALIQCTRLKIRIVDEAHTYYCCGSKKCLKSSPRIFYHNSFETSCQFCGGYYMKQTDLDVKRSSLYEGSNPVKAGAFLKGLTQLVISDDLKLMHPTSPASFSFLSDLGVMDATSTEALEVKDLHIGEDEVLQLLKSSLVSKQPLTQTLLKKNEPYKENLLSQSSFSSLKRNFGPREAENGKIRVKLFVSKSKKIVCYAEVGEDFVDLVFSFLTIPLGHVIKEMDGASTDGCLDNVYKSIEDLDVEYFKSSNEKEVLLNPKLAPKFGYNNQLIGVKEVSFCDVYHDSTCTANITVYDPKLPSHNEDKSNGGFMAGPTMFTVTDDLSVSPVSAVSCLTVLNKLDVPLCDIQERIVHVGNKEAARLLVAAFGSESVLTRTFLQK